MANSLCKCIPILLICQCAWKRRGIQSVWKSYFTTYNTHFTQKFTISKSHFSQSSHFQNLIFHKIHTFQAPNSKAYLDKKWIRNKSLDFISLFCPISHLKYMYGESQSQADHKCASCKCLTSGVFLDIDKCIICCIKWHLWLIDTTLNNYSYKKG